MATSKIKGLDEQLLEGGGGGGGYRSARGANEKRLEKRINDMPAKERASLEDVGKQFETLSPMAQRAQAKIDRRAGRLKSEVIDLTKGSKSAKEEAARNKELTASRREEALNNAKTEGIKTEYPYIEPTERKKGGTVSASRRADGIAMRGKTKGRMC